jgi:hypothetical protein
VPTPVNAGIWSLARGIEQSWELTER